MKLDIDHHFLIGKSHESHGLPCQDHVLTGTLDHGDAERAFAIVSDGCSSGGHTDIGSRIITTTTAKAMRIMLPSNRDFDSEHPEKIYRVALSFAEAGANCLGLENHDLLATQLFAVVEPSGHAFVSIYGDGAIATVDDEGAIDVMIYAWDLNTPFYPHQDRNLFIEAQGGNDNPSFTQKMFKLLPNGEVINSVEQRLTTEEGMNGVTWFSDLPREKVRLLCLFSDGIMQVDKMSVVDVIRNVLAFKNLSGEFVKRRLIRFLKDSKQLGVGPLDDLSVAVIKIDSE